MNNPDGKNPDQAIRIDHLSKSFDGRPVLEDVSFEVAGGEAFGILGKSGTGKSVTLKLVIGLLCADGGKISVGGEEIQELDRENLMRVRKTVGFMFPGRGAVRFDLPGRKHCLSAPPAYFEILKQRLAISCNRSYPPWAWRSMRTRCPRICPAECESARGWPGRSRSIPPILLVDEPNSGLDPVTASEIYTLLESLKEKRHTTLLLVTHDAMGVRRFADRLGVLDQGRLIASGPPEELAKSENELVRALASGAGG